MKREHDVAVFSASLIEQAQIRKRIDNYITVGNPSESQLYLHARTILMELSGEDLLVQLQVDEELPGGELKVSLVQMTAAPLPHGLKGRGTTG